MKKNIKSITLAILLMSSLAACQDIKDTYADMAGDGEIRYIGMCSNLTVSSGWKRLIVNWDNNVDPVIDKIKVKWQNDDMADSVLLDKGTDTYNITNLEDATYEVIVSSLDKEGRSSLTNTIYGRPYTNNHEEVLSFTRVIAKHFYLGNNLIMLFSGWQNGLESAILKYTKTDGSEGELALNADITSQPIYVLPDEINPQKPVTLYRKGKIGTCTDLITFAPYDLSHQAIYTSDFKDFIKKKYGMTGTAMNSDGNINDRWAENIETLELDADINSLEDLLYMPKLKKLIIGKNTYLTELGASDAKRGQYKLYDPTISNKVLEIMHQHTGLTVERYNKHFQGMSTTYVKEMGIANLPHLNCHDLSKANITVTPEDQDGYNSHPEYLIDGKTNTCWKPFASSSQQTYTFTVDIGKEVDASGVKVVQKYFDEYAQDNDIAPQKIIMQYAGADGGFQDATYQTENYIGTSTGQTILLPFAKGKQKVRYLKFMVLSQYYYGTFDVTLAEVGLYK